VPVGDEPPRERDAVAWLDDELARERSIVPNGDAIVRAGSLDAHARHQVFFAIVAHLSSPASPEQ